MHDRMRALAFTLAGGDVLWSDGLQQTDLTIADGLIADAGAGHRLDVSGCLVLPGIVDVHGDGFERHVAPRRGAMTDLAAGLIAIENELAANGITTAVLAQFWSWEGGMRRPEFAERFATALGAFEASIDLRMQLRFEFPLVEDIDAVLSFVALHGVGYLVFNDHVPHDHLAAGKRVPRLEGQALKSRRSPADHLALMERLHAGMPQAWAALPDMVATLTAAGVRLGSHDDGDPETRRRWREIGVPICEFPTTRVAAEEALAADEPVILGAPNVVRGASHKSGGMSARELLDAGVGNALASDYHYPSPMSAVRRLLAEGWPLERAWPLVSTGPAELLGLADRGRIVPGHRADIIVTNKDLTRVLAVFARGRPVLLGGELAARGMDSGAVA